MVYLYKQQNRKCFRNNSMKKLIIDQSNKFYKTWTDDNGWCVDYTIAKPRITKKGRLGCRWQKPKSKNFADDETAAEEFYIHQLAQLDAAYFHKEIAQFQIMKIHLTQVHAECPNCGQPADVVSFVMNCGGEEEPNCPIICKHCASNNTNPFYNSIGVYFFKDENFETDPLEHEFKRDKYIITVKDIE